MGTNGKRAKDDKGTNKVKADLIGKGAPSPNNQAQNTDVISTKSKEKEMVQPKVDLQKEPTKQQKYTAVKEHQDNSMEHQNKTPPPLPRSSCWHWKWWRGFI